MQLYLELQRNLNPSASSLLFAGQDDGTVPGHMVQRIAMWSGPRNISSAMMRSWGNRPDALVCDEPLYAHYLLQTRVAHPGADEVIKAQENDWRKVVEWLTTFESPGKTIFYQKHMTHHLLPQIDRGWLDRVTNAFLIREPREVVTSFIKIAGTPRLEETGLPQQLEIFNMLHGNANWFSLFWSIVTPSGRGAALA